MEALVVADDLTGALDTGHGFAARGLETVVALESEVPGEPSVLVRDTNSRHASPAAAREAVLRAIGDSDPPLVYKKVDSTLRGNVASEVEAVLEATGADRAVVAPAFPAAGRTTQNGIQLVDGVPLAETAYAADAAPRPTDRLPALFEAIGLPVDHVPLETVSAGTSAIREAFEDSRGEGPRVTTVDATDDDHLASIARAIAALRERVVPVGSGGLAAHVVLPGTDPDSGADAGQEAGTGGHTRSAERDPGSGVLAVVGSVADATLAGLGAVPDREVIELDRGALRENPERIGREAGERARRRLARGEHAVLTAARSREDVGPVAEAAPIRHALAAAATAALADRPLRGLFLTGGDSARAVCGALGVGAIGLAGKTVAAGVPKGRIADGPLAGTPLVTKAGGFGGESTIVTVLRALGGNE